MHVSAGFHTMFHLEKDILLLSFISITILIVFWIYHRWQLVKIRRQQREIEENEYWLNEAQQIGNIGSWYRYADSSKCRWSPQLKRILEVDEDEELSFGLFCEHIHPDDVERVVDLINQIENGGGSCVIQFRIVRRDGSIAYLENKVNASVDSGGAVIAVYGSALDVTERKLNEDRLTKALRDAESANRAKSVFLSMVSHDLRTPLNAVKGFSSLIAEQNLSGEQYRSYGKSINAASRALSATINDVLELSSLEERQFRLLPEKVNLLRMMEELRAVFKLSAAQKGIEVKFSASSNLPSVIADGKRLRQIMINLISNALKFTEKGSVTVTASVRTAGEDGMRCDLTLSVTDTGIGIKSTDQERIFNAFEQAHADTSRRFGGSGLGLAIVSQLIELMNGRITLESSAGCGSIFTVMLPGLPLSGDEGGDTAEQGLLNKRAADGVGQARLSLSSRADRSYEDCRRRLQLTSELLGLLRCEFEGRFAGLADGINIAVARGLAADLGLWAQQHNDNTAMKFVKEFSTLIETMDVVELQRLSNLICGRHT